MKISVVILTYRCTDCLRRCLESLVAQERPASAALAIMSGTCRASWALWPEAFGNVGVEANSYGLPVVAYDCGAIGS